MNKPTELTFVLMDAPFQSARTTTAMRLIDIAVKAGHVVNVFAFAGAVYLPLAAQRRHPSALHGRDAQSEDHPLPQEWVRALLVEAAKNGGQLNWVNCGVCSDERGAVDIIEGVGRGSPLDFWSMTRASDNTLVIATK